MKKIYLVPDRNDLKELRGLQEKYNICFEYNDFFTAEVLEDKKLQETIIKAYKDEGIDFSKDTIHGAFFDITLHSSDPQIRRIAQLRIRQSMDIARKMGVRGVVFHSGVLMRFHQPAYVKNWCDRNEEFYRMMLDEYPEQEIFVENMFDDDPKMLLQLAKRMRDCDRFGICLDYAHELLYDVTGKAWLDCLNPYVRHMHINDNNGLEDEHLAVGAGTTDWKKFYDLYNQYKMDASVLIEVNGLEKQRESLAYIEKIGLLQK